MKTISTIIAICSVLAMFCSNSQSGNRQEKPEYTNNISNPGMEESIEDSWVVNYIMGAEGSVLRTDSIKRSGDFSVKLSKHNSVGYVQLTSKEKIRIEPGSTYTFRFWFNSSNAQVTSFLVPRLVPDNNSTQVSNPNSALWVNYDYDSQTLMRNSPSTSRKDWIKRVVFYENQSDETQEILVQVMLYGNPFDVCIDDLEFFKGKKIGDKVPQNPVSHYTDEQVYQILESRDTDSAYIVSNDGKTEFFLNGEKAWPVFYRALPGRIDENGNTFQDPAGFAEQGININNVVVPFSKYGMGSDDYDWEFVHERIMQTLRKNPQAKLFLDLDMGPSTDWKEMHPDEVWETREGEKLHDVSYSSLQWRKDGSEAIINLISDLKKHGFWKIVVGANIVGGHDWQFWTKAIGEYAEDHSVSHKKAWTKYLIEKYKDIETLNDVWKTDYQEFSEINIPDTPEKHEARPAIMERGPIPDFRAFCEVAAFQLREGFAKTVKDESNKRIFVSAYGMPMENQHGYFFEMARQKKKANDMIASMSFYSYRQPGFASGYHPEQTFGYHNTGFIQELDLRSFASDKSWYDELSLMWVSSQPDIKSWRNMHRKLVGVSLAQDYGYWYYDMDKQFVDKDVLNEVGEVKDIADKLVNRKGVSFRPDVCLVRFDDESRYYGTSVDNAAGATVQWQYMMLETSGVPYDVHYLTDIMNISDLQDYKIYIFHNHSYISDEEREWINKNLKNSNRTIIWMYDSGYVGEEGSCIEEMSELVGMKINTDKKYSRAVNHVCSNHEFTGGEDGYYKVPEFQGMAEALCAIFTTSGPSSLKDPFKSNRFGYTISPGVSRYQKFWIEEGYDNSLGKYLNDDKVSSAVKYYPEWTSVYIGSPNALAGEMMNNIAKKAGAYRCGPPGLGEVRMSGRFMSYHALKNGEYKFLLPENASRIINVNTGEVIANGVDSYTIKGEAQNTYWFFIE